MNSIKTSIPEVVVNFDRHTERLAWLSENALAVNLEFERIAAVDAKDAAARREID